MSPQVKALLKLTSAVVLAVVGIGWVIARVNSVRKTGAENSQVWFYDESEKRIYTSASDMLRAPFELRSFATV